MKDSLMDSLDNIRAYDVYALISNPVLPFFTVLFGLPRDMSR
jgi:hypothetical protein